MNENVPFNMEADSLNCIVLGEDVTPDKPEWDIFVKEVRKEMTLKGWTTLYRYSQNICSGK
jgi:oxepin-CoA hydrolase/3-oxo-5,6-dehydrosuberyl-CoA semialdehyde dehydrogenase